MAAQGKKLAGKVAIITGSSSGIGAGIATVFAKEGANVSLTGRNEEELKKVAKECEKLGAKTVLTVGDISKPETRASIVKNTVDKLGKIDILVNNAGVIKPCSFNVGTLDDFDFIFNINVKAVFHLMSLCVPHLTKTKGNIVNISSVGGLVPTPTGQGFTAYVMTKAAVDMLTKNAAAEMAPSHIRVNAVSPGLVMTNLARETSHLVQDKAALEKMLAQHSALHAMNRPGTPEEIAKSVLFLASDDATFTTGVNLVADGGYCIKREIH